MSIKDDVSNNRVVHGRWPPLPPYPQRRNICGEWKLGHNWKDGPTFGWAPPTFTRICLYCGRREALMHEHWQEITSE